MSVHYCRDCNRPMSWYPEKEQHINGRPPYPQGSKELCLRDKRRAQRAAQPTNPRPGHPYGGPAPFVDVDDLIQFVEWGYHPDELTQRFGYKDRQCIYIRLKRLGRTDLKERLKERVMMTAIDTRFGSVQSAGRGLAPRGRRFS